MPLRLIAPAFPREISRGRTGHLKMHAAGERVRQPALRVDGLRIEPQRVLELADCLCVSITRQRL